MNLQELTGTFVGVTVYSEILELSTPPPGPSAYASRVEVASSTEDAVGVVCRWQAFVKHADLVKSSDADIERHA